MRWALRIAGLLSVAACGTLVGHALTYLLEGRTIADGRHGYFSPLLEIVFAAAAISFVILVVRALRASGDDRVCATPPLWLFWVTIATIQVAGFAALESLEGNAPDMFGWCVEVLVALVVVVAVSLFLGFVERCVFAIAAPYASRARYNGNAIRLLAAGPGPAVLLAICVGIHRFKRPPPLAIG
jgi:hypothetical protein